MYKRLLILAGIYLLISCSKNESADPLTNGLWILDNGTISTTKETLKFNTDGTYKNEFAVALFYQYPYVLTNGTLAGNYERKSDKINFISSKVDLALDTSLRTVYPSIHGQQFYGYIVSGLFQNDSALIDSKGQLWSLISDSLIQGTQASQQRTWTIKNLTNDSLKVEADNRIIKYFKE